MSDLRTTLEVEPAAAPDGVFRPGDPIRVTARFETASPWEVAYAEVILFWRTSGKGTRDEGVAAIWRPLRAGERVDVGAIEPSFTFVAPPLPPSYAGRLLKIEWFAGLYVRPKGMKESEVEMRVVIGEPAGEDAAGRPGPEAREAGR